MAVVGLSIALSAPAGAAYFAYAPAAKSNNDDLTANLFVVDGAYASRVTEVDIPAQVYTYTVSDDGERVFFSHAGDRLTVFDATRNRVVTTLDRPTAGRLVARRVGGAERLYLSAIGRLVILEGDPAQADYSIRTQLTTDYAGTGLALTPLGDRLLLSGGTGLALVDTSGPTLLDTLDLSETAGQVAIDPRDPRRAYVLLPVSRRLLQLDLIDDRIQTGDTLALGDQADPRNLVVAPDGRLFIADRGRPVQDAPSSGAVLVVDPDAWRLDAVIDTTGSLTEYSWQFDDNGNPVPPPHFPVDLGLSPDGSRLFVLQDVWIQEAGLYLSIFQDGGSSWDELGRVKVGQGSTAVGDLVGPDCTACPRGYQPKAPSPEYTRPAAFGPLTLALLLTLAWRRRNG